MRLKRKGLKLLAVFLGLSLIAAGCGDSSASGGDGPGGNGAGAENQGAGQSTGGNASGAGGPGGSSNEGGGGGNVVLPSSVDVTFENNGASGVTRVNFALPLTEGTLSDASLVAVSVGAGALEAHRPLVGTGAGVSGSEAELSYWLRFPSGEVNTLPAVLAAGIAAHRPHPRRSDDLAER